METHIFFRKPRILLDPYFLDGGFHSIQFHVQFNENNIFLSHKVYNIFMLLKLVGFLIAI
jgi:hypothetical protein